MALKPGIFKKLKIILVILAIFVLGFFFKDYFVNFYQKITLNLPQIEKGINDFLQMAEKEILAPPPLVFQKDAEESFLTKEGVIFWTNEMRKQNGLLPLQENLKLDFSAQIKLEDMFENQYFAHDSLSGEGVGDLAAQAGYEFIIIGENLAMGGFENDEILVKAWMDSPGHRENILNIRYREIGVAVRKGIFNGKTTWLAVQHFARPLSSCPQPDSNLLAEISANKQKISVLETDLASLRAEIQMIRPRDRENFNLKVSQYNVLVSEYNAIIYETEAHIFDYNLQVKSFNDCVAAI